MRHIQAAGQYEGGDGLTAEAGVRFQASAGEGEARLAERTVSGERAPNRGNVVLKIDAAMLDNLYISEKSGHG